MMSESRAIAPTLTTGNRVASIVPTSFDDCVRLSQLLAQSSLVPTAYKGKPEDICVAVMQGLEVGLSPLAALASIAVINGRASLWGDGMLAVVLASGLVESIEETDDGTTATCTIKRRGEPKPIVRRFSLEDAKRAGLAGKAGPWTQYPQRMRQMRARSWAIRDGFADALKGLYSAEEAQDVPMRDITPRRDVSPAALAPPPAVPDIPDAPPPTVPDAPDPPHDPETGEIKPTDAEYLAALDDELAGCSTAAAIAETVEANNAEVERRGVEQAANDLIEVHRARLANALAAAKPKKPSAAAKAAAFAPPPDAHLQKAYVRIIKAMRAIEYAAGGTLKDLYDLWKSEWGAIQSLPDNWQAELTKEKDAIKAKLQPKEQAA